jgi:hypothetical protein
VSSKHPCFPEHRSKRLYDPHAYHDRLLLGLSGIMSEALSKCFDKASYANLPIMPTWGVAPTAG